jgi:hypothetical protein
VICHTRRHRRGTGIRTVDLIASGRTDLDF